MDFTVANLQFHKGKWKHGKRKARLPLEVFVVTKKDDNIDTKKLLIANFDFDANTNFNKIKTSSMENSIPLTNICNNTNNNNYNNIIAINEKKLIDEISSSERLEMVKDETITEGMIPKINACLDAVNNGVTAAGIINGTKQHSCLWESFSDKGSGTLIRK